MTKYEIPEPIKLPFFEREGNLWDTIKESSSRRGKSTFSFIYSKTRNIILYRLAFFCPFNSLRIKMHRWRGIKIGKHCYIAQQCSLDNAYPELIYIEDYVSINQGSTVIAHTNARSYFKDIIPCIAAPVVFRHHAFCAINTTILPGVEIGEYAVVTAGSVVNTNIEACSLAQGIPAKVHFKFDRIIKRNLKKNNK